MNGFYSSVGTTLENSGATLSLLGLLDFLHRFSSSTSPSSSCVWLRLDREPQSLMSERRRCGGGMGSSAAATENSDSSIERRTPPAAVAWVGSSFVLVWPPRDLGRGLEWRLRGWHGGGMASRETEALASTTGDHRRQWQKG
jgi:hypothetical protein